MSNGQNSTIYIVRHGETEYNLNKIIQGQNDSPLTPLGKEQAKQRAEWFKDTYFDAVFSSDLLRAKHTAEILNAERNLVVNTTKLLRERRFGRFEGKSTEYFLKESEKLIDELVNLSESEKRRVKFDIFYESEEELADRLLIFLREIAITYLGKNVLLVSHGGAIRSLLMRFGYLTYNELRGHAVKNLAYIKIESDGVDFFVKETHGILKSNK
jgi:broad specificity phosphatase PhoE